MSQTEPGRREDRIAALIAKWRAMADLAFKNGPIYDDEDAHMARWTSVEMCADELEALHAATADTARQIAALNIGRLAEQQLREKAEQQITELKQERDFLKLQSTKI